MYDFCKKNPFFESSAGMLANTTGPIPQINNYSHPTMAPMPIAAPMPGIALLNLQYAAVSLQSA